MCFDTAQVREMGLVILENDFLKAENGLLTAKAGVQARQISDMNEKILSLEDIIDMKELQIKKLETPIIVNQSNNWLLTIGALLAGLTAGYFITK